MKRNLLYALMAATMLAGCAKNDVVDSEINKDGNLIGFSTYKNISRGNPVDGNGNQTKGNEEFLTNGYKFGVTAFISGTSTSPYMGTISQGIEIVSNGTKWGYKNSSDQAYWPTKGEMLDFYAYAPYLEHPNTVITSTAFDKTNGLTIGYTVPALEGNQVDLMYAMAKDITKPANGNIVTLPFKHALTQLHFKIGTSATNLKVDVEENGIQVFNLKNSGSFNFQKATTPPTQNEIWTLGETKTNYTVTSPAVEKAGYYQAPEGYTQVGTYDKALMLLPQTFTAWNATDNANGVYLEISCKIYQVLADETKVYLHGQDGDNGYAPIKVGISSKKEDLEVWARGNKVTYNLLIGAQGGVLSPIEFETTVDPWLDADGGEIKNEQLQPAE